MWPDASGPLSQSLSLSSLTWYCTSISFKRAADFPSKRWAAVFRTHLHFRLLRPGKVAPEASFISGGLLRKGPDGEMCGVRGDERNGSSPPAPLTYSFFLSCLPCSSESEGRASTAFISRDGSPRERRRRWSTSVGVKPSCEQREKLSRSVLKVREDKSGRKSF